jgi:exodeoxyribonuclease VII small subunit
MMDEKTGGSSGDQASDDESLGYAAALAELEEILQELDGDDVDVDILGARVRRATELLRLCRQRIARARLEVEQVVAELEDMDQAMPTPGDDTE